MALSTTGQIMRASLRTKGANGARFFIPQCTKLVFEYCESWPTSGSTRSYLGNHARALAEANPHVEIVVKQRPSKQPLVRGFYINGRTKEISLKGYEVTTIQQKVQLLLDSSGAKIKPLKRKPVESSSGAARGIWSALHVQEPFKI